MITLPNAEGEMREWLRSFSAITDLVQQRVYFSIPEQDRPELPCIVMYRYGGRPDPHGQDYPAFAIECWGTNKKEASDLALVVAGCIADSVNQAPVDTTNARVLSGQVDSGPRESGKVSWAKRYRLDATFMLR